MSTANVKASRSGTNQEFTAIVLAGLGGNLSPLTNTENCPKALLPIANKALLAYPLAWIDRAGLSSVIILCLDAHETAINHWLKTTWRGSCKPLLLAASAEDEIVGSADAIRTLLQDSRHRDKIRPDVILLSCDTICEIPPYDLLDAYRLSRSTITSVFHRNHGPEIVTPLKKSGKTFTGYESATATLLYTSAVADVEEDLALRTSMLWKFPKVSFTSGLTDLHLYVCRKSVLDLIVAERAISRVNTDLLPLLCKMQFQSLLRAKYDIEASCKIYMAHESHFCARVNTKQAFIDLNKHLLKSIPAEQRIVPPSTVVGERTTIGTDSAVGTDSCIDEKTTIKRSLVGNHVKIGKMCRITNCIIMDHAEVRDSVKMENCVICCETVVGEKSVLKDCTLGGKVVLPDKSEKKGEEIVMGGEISIGA